MEVKVINDMSRPDKVQFKALSLRWKSDYTTCIHEEAGPGNSIDNQRGARRISWHLCTILNTFSLTFGLA